MELRDLLDDVEKLAVSKINKEKYFFARLKKKARAQKENSLYSCKICPMMVLVMFSIVLKGTFEDLRADYTSLKNLLEFFIW